MDKIITIDKQTGARYVRRVPKSDRSQMADAMDKLRGSRDPIPRNRTRMGTGGGETGCQANWL